MTAAVVKASFQTCTSTRKIKGTNWAAAAAEAKKEGAKAIDKMRKMERETKFFSLSLIVTLRVFSFL